MRRNRITTSAGLGFALCLAASSTAYADDTASAASSAPANPPVTVEITDVSNGSATDEGTSSQPSAGTSSDGSGTDTAASGADATSADASGSSSAAAGDSDSGASNSGTSATAGSDTSVSADTSTSDSTASGEPAAGAADPDTADPDTADSDATDSEAANSEASGSETTDSEAADSQTTDSEATDSETTNTSASAADAQALPADGEPAVQAYATAAVITPLAITPMSVGQTVTTVADGITPDQIVASLVGTGITVSNVVYTGHDTAVGIAAGMGAIGINGGVVLSSGSVQVTPGDKGGLVGPNENDGYTGDFGNPGDPNLDVLAGDSTHDAAVLEFDFVPTSDQLVFHYVFASEEYNEYVGSYNDVFAFYVNGVNCATVGGAPVSVNNINNGVNSDLYVDNDLDDVDPSALHDTEMDGFTTVLSCTAAVNAGQTNHIKLAIADALDYQLDSLVVIQQGSFSSQPPPVAVDDAYSTPDGEALVIVVPGLQGNDTQSADGGPLASVKVTDPANGTVTINADGSFTYVPNEGFTGTDTFTYLVTDLWGNSNIATVTINVATGEVIPEVTPIDTPPAPPVVAPGVVAVVTPVSADVVPVSAKSEVLAATGLDVVPLGSISVTLLGAGIALVMAGRRRTSS